MSKFIENKLNEHYILIIGVDFKSKWLVFDQRSIKLQFEILNEVFITLIKNSCLNFCINKMKNLNSEYDSQTDAFFSMVQTLGMNYDDAPAGSARAK